MKMTPGRYGKMVKDAAPKTPCRRNCLLAFLFGGGLCALAQVVCCTAKALGAQTDMAFTCSSLTLITLSAVLTACNVFDKIGTIAGAGTLVPITGFANAVVAPAIDTKSEGFILGVGAKIFIISGPVILYGIFSGAVYGVIYWLIGLFT